MDNINNETLGQTAEKVICDLSGLDSSDLVSRSNLSLEIKIKPIIIDALKNLPKITKHGGLEKGQRGGQSKSPIDFYCHNNETISVKTGDLKLCPSGCGQPGPDTFDHYFGHLYDGRINHQKCKELVISKIEQMMPIYIENLFDCDYLLHIYIGSKGDRFYIFPKIIIPEFDWDIKRFTFTRGLEMWNESTTIKYNNLSIAEFQLHQHRSSYKFRIYILNLFKVLGI
jgi:hypothetical protein